MTLGICDDPDVHSSSAEYASRFSGAVGCWMLEVQENLVCKALEVSNISTILDVGGGHGQVARAFSRLTAQRSRYAVTVLGSTMQCSEQIADLLQEGKCTFREGSLVTLPFPDDSFDAVTCLRIVSHISDWPKLISELCRVARHRVVIDYPPITGLHHLAGPLFALKQRLEGNTRQYRSFNADEIHQCFRQQGFKIESEHGQFSLPMVLHRRLKMPGVSRTIESALAAVGIQRWLGAPRVLVAENGRLPHLGANS